MHGTEGRDVIVTNNSFGVFSGGGDDLVCVTGRATGADGRGRDVCASAERPTNCESIPNSR